MQPRLPLDIGWSDLAAGFLASLAPPSRRARRERLERLWSANGGGAGDGMACLSVRSGLDLLLGALDLPAGSEVAYTAATIGDMVRVIEHHGLTAVPIDLDMDRLGPRPEQLERALGPRTRAILFVHLFGSRFDLSPLAELARRRGLLLIEDCAHAFVGRGWRGDERADASLFSFGPIKTATALGGAMLTVRQPELLARMRELESRRPVQSRLYFARRCLKYAALKALCWPPLYGLLFRLARRLGADPSALVGRMVRGFSGGDLLTALRHQPSAPLLTLLARRLDRYGAPEIEARRRVGDQAVALLGDEAAGSGVERPGTRALAHTYWLFPVLCDDPDRLIARLQAAGFDAARGTVSFGVIDPGGGAEGRCSPEAQAALSRVVYLPLARTMPARTVAKICTVVRTEADPASPERR